MDTAHLKAFLKIAECGSISRAAQSLAIAQPSLSQQLLRLEDEIGFALFERSARGVLLTQAGHVFRERAREILHAAEQAVADALHLRNDLRGQVVVAMPPSLARLVGAGLVTALAEQSPSAGVRIVEAFHGSIRGWLEAEKIDLGILHDLQPLRHLAARALLEDELLLVGPPGRFGTLAAPAAAAMAGLADLPLSLPGIQHGLRQLLEREADRARLKLAVRHEVDSIDVALDLAAEGAACTVLPRAAVAPAARAGRCSVARIGEGGLRRTLSVVRNPAIVLTHASVRVETLLRAELARLAADRRWDGRVLED